MIILFLIYCNYESSHDCIRTAKLLPLFYCFSCLRQQIIKRAEPRKIMRRNDHQPFKQVLKISIKPLSNIPALEWRIVVALLVYYSLLIQEWLYPFPSQIRLISETMLESSIVMSDEGWSLVLVSLFGTKGLFDSIRRPGSCIASRCKAEV
jgi:hypothetical protein